MDKDIKEGLRIVLEEKCEAALVTITKVLGSVPRKPGAQMLIFADGRTVGSIGGGCGEAEAKRKALMVMNTHTVDKYHLNMTADIAEDEGMVCGGIMELFIEYIGLESTPEQLVQLENYLDSLDRGDCPIMVTVTESLQNHIGRKMIIQKDGKFFGDLGSSDLNRAAHNYIQANGNNGRFAMINLDASFIPCEKAEEKIAFQLLVEPQISEIQLLILGGGHIALPLVSIAKILGYDVIVVDDRPSFANHGRFGTADRVICNNFEQALDEIEIGPQTYVVIVTRGHRYDKECLKKVIYRPAGYIGMIGSRRRVKALLAELLEEGFPSERLQSIYSPIGLKIGAETPEEIALCILGEIIQVQKDLNKLPKNRCSSMKMK
ncbi:XdhC/CoxI family protein [Desulfosporosinus fructosivorans]|uniref:XdhC/CoxI family protein n=1 Tax=Desulfosporosinus fructosivorans TaxID=2018669 RepID=A0A4Z0R937_9FIRM|nr:XdhC/CoxI family protein [Desulfosporosinus fructosivorans]TGE39318.1 XdhC/CoxI family protein [Desulfosporosinus fructosivorans]